MCTRQHPQCRSFPLQTTPPAHLTSFPCPRPRISAKHLPTGAFASSNPASHCTHSDADTRPFPVTCHRNTTWPPRCMFQISFLPALHCICMDAGRSPANLAECWEVGRRTRHGGRRGAGGTGECSPCAADVGSATRERHCGQERLRHCGCGAGETMGAG